MVRRRELEDVVRIIAPVLNDWELFYAAVEDIAKRVYGFPSEFNEIDLLVNLTEEDQRKIGKYLESRFFSKGDATEDPKVFEDKNGPTRVRFFKTRDQLDMMTIGRRTLHHYAYSSIFLASVEDMLLRELRTGERNRFKEAVDMYSYWRNHLDMSYLISTSRQLGLYDKFIKMKKKGDKRF